MTTEPIDPKTYYGDTHSPNVLDVQPSVFEFSDPEAQPGWDGMPTGGDEGGVTGAQHMPNAAQPGS